MTVTFAKLGHYGRMGNQLWQCAATLGYAFRYDCDYMFPRWEYEKDFNIPATKFTQNIRYDSTYEEPHFHYAGISYQQGLNLHGYFQSYKYWQDYGKAIRSMLTPTRHQERVDDTTAIHVRRTDYLVHTGCYNILDMKYYEKAMELANTPKYLVFSDDIKWCQEHFVGNNFEFSEGNSTVVDFSIMIKCKNNIIANSSYSWWAAWLNSSADKKIFVPKVWFGPQLSPTHDIKDLYPNEWVKVDGGNYGA